MPITKQKKVEIVKELESRVVPSPAVVFVNFHGLKVAQATELRKSLRESRVGFMVAKKTLLRRALGASKIAGEMPALEGEVAVAYLASEGADVVAPARGVHQFGNKHKDSVKILGGIFEKAYLGAAAMLEIATIPSREVLYGKFLNIINSPIQRVVMALDQIAKAKTN